MNRVPSLLTREELYTLTRRTQPAAQVRWLTHAGWKFARDSDGYPIVAREEFQRNMIGAVASGADPAADHAAFEVNLGALQRLRGIRVLRVRQGKTGKSLDIQLSGELERLVNECLAEPVVHQTFVHRDDGKRYTYDGISCMFRRYVKKCGLKDFGFYDLKGKAATDMYRAGVPLEQIQHLLGHTSIKTTEVYIKARLPDLVAPTSRPMVKQQAQDGR